MCAIKAQLPYNDHKESLKLPHSLDRRVCVAFGCPVRHDALEQRNFLVALIHPPLVVSPVLQKHIEGGHDCKRSTCYPHEKRRVWDDLIYVYMLHIKQNIQQS